MSPTVELVVDGLPVRAEAGASVAAVLLAGGRRSWRTTPSGARRGLFCGIGVCFDCTATVDGTAATRTCITPVAAGMTVDTGGDDERAGTGVRDAPGPARAARADAPGAGDR